MFGNKKLVVDIEGLTCGHCVAHTTKALEALEGVKKVNVDLVKGGTSRATVTYRGDLADPAITDAIDEAGYTVTAIRK